MKRLILFSVVVVALVSALARAAGNNSGAGFGGGSSGSGGGGGGGASPANPQIATVTLTSAQLKTLDYVPVTIIPAPGANKAIIVTGGSYQAIFGTRAYTIVGEHLGLTYGGIHLTAATNIVDVTDAAPSILLTGSVSSLWPLGPSLYPLISSLSLPLTVISNQSVTLTNFEGHSYNNGPIVTATLHAAGGGVGYLLNDTGVIDPGLFCSNGDATYKVTGVSGTAVTTFQVTAAGTLYQLNGGGAGDVTADCGNGAGAGYLTGTGGGQPGVGTGFIVNVGAVTAGDWTLAVTVFYQVVTLQ
jgi:hypothetical protein